jgi:hypothetical protein
MHIMPTRGRPLSLQRFFDEGKPEQKGVIIADLDQQEMYASVHAPDGWWWVWVKPMQGFVKKCNIGFEEFPTQEWYAFGGDDCVGRTPHWDSTLSTVAKAGYIAWGNDLVAGKCTQPFIPGDLVRHMGWLVHPAFKHLYVDLIWEEIARDLSIARYFPDIIQEHLHFSTGKAPRDRTSYERMERGDHAVFAKFDMESVLEKARCASSLS